MKVIKIYKPEKPENIVNATLIYNTTLYNFMKHINILFIKNNKIHNEKFQAEYLIYDTDHYKYHLLYNEGYSAMSNKQWVKKVKQLKRKHKLNIFI